MAGFIDYLQIFFGLLIVAFIIGGIIAGIIFIIRLRRIKKQTPKELIKDVRKKEIK